MLPRQGLLHSEDAPGHGALQAEAAAAQVGHAGEDGADAARGGAEGPRPGAPAVRLRQGLILSGTATDGGETSESRSVTGQQGGPISIEASD